MYHFADMLMERVRNRGPIIVGIDPNFELMPDAFLPSSAGIDEVYTSLVSFSRSITDAVSDQVAAVKFQSAHFERFGSTGVEAMASAIRYAKERDLIVILDAKRGDIDATSWAYACGYLAGSTAIGSVGIFKSDLEVDAMTVNPFLGKDAINPFIETATKHHKGIFILVKTSNPGSSWLQELNDDGETVSESLASIVHAAGMDSVGECGYSCIGAVVGSTFPDHVARMRKIMPKSIFLVPGIGAQGGTIEAAATCLDRSGAGAVISISRSVIYPTVEELTGRNYMAVVRAKVQQFKDRLAVVR